MAPSGLLVEKTEEEWRTILSPEQFRILRQKGTEEPRTGEYDKFFEEGVFSCVGCKTPLYKSTTKFDAGCGWPAFFEGVPGAINRIMGEEPRSLVQRAMGIEAMFTKEKDSLHQPMNAIVLTACRSIQPGKTLIIEYVIRLCCLILWFAQSERKQKNHVVSKNKNY